MPSRPFRKFFDRKLALTDGGLSLKICPRVHFKAVIVDGSRATVREHDKEDWTAPLDGLVDRISG